MWPVSLRRLVSRILGRQSDPAIGTYLSPTAATLEDIRYCYRLLLNRPPDPEGWAFYSGLVEKADLPVDRLVAAFLDSAEYRAQHQEHAQVLPVVLEGFTVFVTAGDLEVGAGLRQTGSYEPHVTKELTTILAESAVFVDVGANIGYFAMLAAARVGATGRVIAFEPNPQNCALIRRSIAANGFAHVVVHEYAGGDVDGEFAIDITGSNGALRAARHAGDQRVRAVILDTFLADEPRIDIVKMDVEGFEGRVVRGMRELLKRHRPVLFTEFSPVELSRRSNMDGRTYLLELAALGYALFVLPTEGSRSRDPQTPDEILRVYSNARTSHLDLVAYMR